MKTRFVKFACFLGAISAFALSAGAQDTIARANVPFEFAAGGAMMPPGQYTVDAPVPGVLTLHGSAGNSVALLTITSEVPPPSTSAKLLFERRDGMAYLSGVEWPDQSVKLASPFLPITKPSATASLH